MSGWMALQNQSNGKSSCSASIPTPSYLSSSCPHAPEALAWIWLELTLSSSTTLTGTLQWMLRCVISYPSSWTYAYLLTARVSAIAGGFGAIWAACILKFWQLKSAPWKICTWSYCRHKTVVTGLGRQGKCTSTALWARKPLRKIFSSRVTKNVILTILQSSLEASTQSFYRTSVPETSWNWKVKMSWVIAVKRGHESHRFLWHKKRADWDVDLWPNDNLTCGWSTLDSSLSKFEIL